MHNALPSAPSPDSLIEDALIVTTELVTNAINAGCSEGWMSWTLAPDCLHLRVFDNAPGWPVRRTPATTDAHGRGLLIIQALAMRSDTEAVDGGKLASATLRVRI